MTVADNSKADLNALQPGVSREPATPSRPIVSQIGLALAGIGVVGACAASLVAPRRPGTFVVLVALCLVWSLPAALLTRRQRCAAGRVVGVVALSIGAGTLSWAVEARMAPSGVLGIGLDLAQRVALTLVPAAVLHLLLSLPPNSGGGVTHRRTVRAGYGVAAGVAVALMVDRAHLLVWPVALLWCVALAAIPLAHARYRSAGTADQWRLQWIGCAATIVVEVLLVASALTLAIGWPGHLATLSLAVTALVPLALAAGTVQRVLPRVDRLLTHTVSLTGLTALIVVAYLVALAAFGRRPDHAERTLLLLSMLAAAATALAYQPARNWLAERANRIVYGERIAPDEALRTWGSRLTRAIPLDELLLQLAEALKKSMQLQSAQIWTGSDGVYEIAAMVPHHHRPAFHIGQKELAVVSRSLPAGGTWLDIWLRGLVEPNLTASSRVAPVAHGGQLLGLIVCTHATDGGIFSEEDDLLLTELARQVGLALHNVQLDTALQASLDELRHTNRELQASRSRIVAAGDAERRKLERNLHDGAQQHLVALAVKLRLAKDAIEDDPADAEAMLDEIRGDVQLAIGELRSLAHGIFPPLLMSGGLAEAIPAAAARASLPTEADVEVGRLPQEVEAAIYFCCVEALQNAGKHAGPEATAVVRVGHDETQVWWSVTDNGAGFDMNGAAGAGQGFLNMGDRMGALGGTVKVSSAPGAGTAITGALPLSS